MLVKVWDSGGAGEVEDDAMVGGPTVLSGQGRGSLAFAAVQAALASSAHCNGMDIFIIASRTYQNADKA